MAASYQTKQTEAWPKHEDALLRKREDEDVEVGYGEGYTEGDVVAQCEAAVQRGFLRKVFGLVGAQLAVTALMSACGMYVPAFQSFLLSNPSMLMVAFIASFGFLFACHIYKEAHPTNLYLLLGFTVSIGWTVATVCAQHQKAGMGFVVLEAVALTAAVTIGLAAYTLKSKRDFSFLGAGLGAALWVLILGGFVGMFVAAPMMHLMLSVAGAAIFSLYIVYDVYLISRRLSPDEYIPASIALYLDIVNLFLHLLRILSEMQGRN